MDTDFVKKMKVFSDLLLTWIKMVRKGHRNLAKSENLSGSHAHESKIICNLFAKSKFCSNFATKIY